MEKKTKKSLTEYEKKFVSIGKPICRAVVVIE